MKDQKYYDWNWKILWKDEKLLSYNTKHFKSSYSCIQENSEVCSNSYWQANYE